MSVRNWSDVPPEMIGLIADRLDSIEDCVRFRGVCTAWRSAVLNQPHVSSKTFPWIMFAHNRCKKLKGYNDFLTHAFYSLTHAFYSLTRSKYYKLNQPEAITHLALQSGSPYGWVVLSSVPHMEIFNPLTRVRVPLPLLTTLKGYKSMDIDYSLGTVVLARSKDRFVVLVVFTEGKVAFTRPGDKNWTSVDIAIVSYHDMLLLNNQAYIVNKDGFVWQFDITDSNPNGLEFALPPADIEEPLDVLRKFYLVEMLGDLYMVVEFDFYFDDSDEADDDPPMENYFRCYFRVFKLDVHTRKWGEVFTLGDYAMFVGRGTSFSLLVSKYPESKSSIYFTDYTYGAQRWICDVGSFNLESKTMVDLHPGDHASNMYWNPFWFIPNLY